MKKLLFSFLFTIFTITTFAQCIAPKVAQVKVVKIQTTNVVEFRIKNLTTGTHQYEVKIVNQGDGSITYLGSYYTSDQADGLTPDNFLAAKAFGLLTGNYTYEIRTFCEFVYFTKSPDALTGNFTIK